MHALRPLGVLFLLVPALTAQDPVPGDDWMRFTDVAEAGFDADALAAAHATWQAMPSSAFLVIADGAVVAAWGEVDRRFMCHSVRKSFLSALYGIYWDRGEIELNQTMEDLGIDDAPSPLLPREEQARILDLLKARSAVYHPAAYAGRTDSAPRGSIGPGQAFGYNNWDFNTLATILMQITGDDVFEAFDEHFAQPLGMEDWRVRDGYYHYERDKSKYPAYPFRMSARDAARFGLLFAREGVWGDERILSHHWVNRSTALYSIDSPLMGYGFMWWVFRKPSLEKHRMFSAFGVGNQMIAVSPVSDLVIVNRADTYADERTPTRPLVALIEEVLAARTGEVVAQPRLEPLPEAPPPAWVTSVTPDELEFLVGTHAFPPPSLGLGHLADIELQPADGHLSGWMPFAGTFAFYLQPDGTLVREDAGDRFLVLRDANGAVEGISPPLNVVRAAMGAIVSGEDAPIDGWLALAEPWHPARVAVAHALRHLRDEDRSAALAHLRSFQTAHPEAPLLRVLLGPGRGLADSEHRALGVALLELAVELFPDAPAAREALAEFGADGKLPEEGSGGE